MGNTLTQPTPSTSSTATQSMLVMVDSINARMHDAGMNGADLSRAAYISNAHISRIRKAERVPTPNVAKAIDRALNAGGEIIALAETAYEEWSATRLPRAESLARAVRFLAVTRNAPQAWQKYIERQDNPLDVMQSIEEAAASLHRLREQVAAEMFGETSTPLVTAGIREERIRK